MGNVISQRYATSIFELACEEDILEKVFEDICSLESIFAVEKDFLAVLVTPTVSREEKDEIIDNVFAANFCERTVSFLHVLIKKGRISSLTSILQDFGELYRQKKGICRACVVSAVPLTDELFAKLVKKLEQITGKTIELKNTVEPSVLGGLMLRLEGKQLDGTVQGAIDALHTAIASAVVS